MRAVRMPFVLSTPLAPLSCNASDSPPPTSWPAVAKPAPGATSAETADIAPAATAPATPGQKTTKPLTKVKVGLASCKGDAGFLGMADEKAFLKSQGLDIAYGLNDSGNTFSDGLRAYENRSAGPRRGGQLLNCFSRRNRGRAHTR